ncbi:hypothetical protein LJB42_001917 [Komagataella kurtzmanii]|nr:hypothetical protein LJB42_001917 [Komagataella kurtzmanii]
MPYTEQCSRSNHLNLLNHHANQVDRFIPNLVSNVNFHGLTDSHVDDKFITEELEPGFLDRPPHFSSLRPQTPPLPTIRSPATSDPPTPISDVSSAVSKKGFENKEVAQALDMSSNTRVYGFQHKTPPGSRSPVASLKDCMSQVTHHKQTIKQAKKFPQITNPFRVLDAPGLRNDFYANLISWSKVTNKIAVGLDKVFIWADDGQVAPLRSLLTEAITCVSYAPCTTFLAVGTKAGRLYLYDNASLICSTVTKPNTSVCCIQWTNTGKELFIGDDTGNVLYYEIKQTYCSYDLVMKNSWNCHQQQICGNYSPHEYTVT